jgi:nucleoside-diphosphate-sugar epimerase
MKILLTGICGFAGSTLALRLREVKAGLRVLWSIDAAGQPTMLAGTGGSGTNSRQLMQYNLEGKSAAETAAQPLRH